jgi:hypothetical protein
MPLLPPVHLPVIALAMNWDSSMGQSIRCARRPLRVHDPFWSRLAETQLLKKFCVEIA